MIRIIVFIFTLYRHLNISIYLKCNLCDGKAELSLLHSSVSHDLRETINNADLVLK